MRKILIAGECSGAFRRAFAWRGWCAVSVDLKPAEDGARWATRDMSKGWHYTGDVFDFLAHGNTGPTQAPWDMLAAFPDCTYLCSSGLHWNHRTPGRAEKTAAALDFAMRLWRLPIQYKVMENPAGRLTRTLREQGARVQFVQPYEYGHDASKATGLALHNLPDLKPTRYIKPRLVCRECGAVYPYGHEGACDVCGTEAGRLAPRWSNQTDSGQNRLGPSSTRAADRARTYPGIADAAAEQWTRFINLQH